VVASSNWASSACNNQVDPVYGSRPCHSLLLQPAGATSDQENPGRQAHPPFATLENALQQLIPSGCSRLGAQQAQPVLVRYAFKPHVSEAAAAGTIVPQVLDCSCSFLSEVVQMACGYALRDNALAHPGAEAAKVA
jgi:hypothetical protein